MVGIEQEHIEPVQISCIPQRVLDRSDVIEIDRIRSQGPGEHRIELIGVVVRTLVPEEEHTDRTGPGIGLSQRIH